jgi:CheY-like chemotaxis protein
MSTDAGSATAAATAVLTTADGRRPRVAIVGGTAASAMVATVLCDQFGCSPLNTRTGESVLALLRRDIPLDLVVLDLAVPDMDGFVAVQLIRALGARGTLPIIALADDSTDMTTTRARAAGFARSVLKPYSPRELYTAMHAALDAAAAHAVTGRA